MKTFTACRGILLGLLLMNLGALQAEPQTQKESESSTIAPSFHVLPAFNVPLGGSAATYDLGGSLAVASDIAFRRVPIIAIRGELGYDHAPLATGPLVSILSLAVGPSIHLPLTSWMQLDASAVGGYFHGFLIGAPTPANQGGAAIRGGAGISFFLASSLSLGLGGSYRNFLGLYQGVNANLTASFYIGRVPDLQVEGTTFESIFPVFYKYYDDHPIGKATLKNSGSIAATDISLDVQVKQFMDAPKACAVPSQLKGGESKSFDLYALFTDKVFEVTEGTKVAVEMQLKYRAGGKQYTRTQVETMRIQFRNAMTWDDDRKASAFVTARDPAIMGFAKNVSSLVKGRVNKGIDANLLTGLALHEALRLCAVSYQVDPRSPYVELHARKQEVDFLQFPRETLNYRAGDCDDLSILYAALLESLGVPTAFITVPGHIFIAFALAMDAGEAQRSFAKPEDLCLQGTTAWIPLEVTDRTGGFLSAWQQGAKQWREFFPRGQAGFYPNAESWKMYEPAALPGSAGSIPFPAEAQLVQACQQEMGRFVDREILPQVQELQVKIQASNGQASMVNKLGVLYARFGLNDKAREEFERILKKEEYTPALVNLGTLFFQSGDMQKALAYCERASRKEPDNAKVLLSLARVNHALENYAAAQKVYARVKVLDPVLAEKHTYLDMKGDDASRAAGADAVRENVIWVE